LPPQEQQQQQTQAVSRTYVTPRTRHVVIRWSQG